LNTTDNLPAPHAAYVTRDVCEAIHAEQREANRRTWDELRGLRRLVILLVVGGQLFSGGLNLAGLGYWLRVHEATPHPGTVEMVEAVRRDVREDLRYLRREVHERLGALVARLEADRPREPFREGESQ